MLHFASENYDKAHPDIIKAIARSNTGFAPSYGKDEHTVAVTKKLKRLLGSEEIEVFYCFNGTGANNFALASITEKYSAILCSDVAHLYTAESTAPETFTGCRIHPIKSANGKIIISNLVQRLMTKNGVHMPEVSVLSITQPTEYGTLYSMEELKTINQLCKANNILLHIDGARIFNALVSMDCSLADFVSISGVDVLTLGGTKAGLMFGEAVIFLNSKRFKNLGFNHKRSMQLASKNRYIAIQFAELFEKDLWKQIAMHSNRLAKYFAKELTKVNGIKIAYPVETNMVFIKMENAEYERLKSFADFYSWDVHQNQVRFAFSFGNTTRDIKFFIQNYKFSAGQPAEAVEQAAE